jgi:penicillin-binding protein 1A
MRNVSGGELAASVWKRFMTAAHQGLPVRDFGTPPGQAPDEARIAFYRDLAAGFASTASAPETVQ